MINSDVTASIIVDKDKFIITLLNSSDKPVYLLRYNGELWCYRIQIWDSLKVGYSISTRSSYEASENHAFLDPGKFTYSELKPKDSVELIMDFDSMGADEEVLSKVKGWLGEARTNTKFACPEVNVRLEPNFDSDVTTIFGRLIQLRNDQ